MVISSRWLAGLVALVAWLGVASTRDAAASVTSSHGNIVCKLAGRTRVLTQSGKDTEPTVSPDGHTVAFVRTLKPAPAPEFPQGGENALWLGDCLSGKVRSLVEPASDKDILGSLGYPVFSLKGDYVYVSLVPGGDYLIIQRVEVKSGKPSFVANAELENVMRSGPYEGDLLATQHTDMIDRQGHHYGGYPYYIFTPTGKTILRIPDSEQWNKRTLASWLKAKGWRAW